MLQVMREEVMNARENPSNHSTEHELDRFVKKRIRELKKERDDVNKQFQLRTMVTDLTQPA